MAKLICKSCKRPFKKGDFVAITDGKLNEAVHDECHYNYLANMHLNDIVTLEEYKEQLKEDQNGAVRRKIKIKKQQYVCLCGNDKDEYFEYLGREGKKYIYKCKKCEKIIKH